MRVRLGVSYDGAGFSGWARQPGRRTVQGVVEEGLARVLRLPDPPVTTVAGRTDAGVHARGQVAHVDLPPAAWAEVQNPLARLARALPDDVRVTSAAPAPPGFDARFSASWRRYTYAIADDPVVADPLRRRKTVVHRRPLDADRMNRAATALLGEHDFAAFCRRREGASTVRTLLELRWDRVDAGRLVMTVRADAFCHSMVRALVGALLPVGDGRRDVDWPAGVLSRGVRDPGVTVVPPHGLVLEEVAYPADEELAARAERTRRRREPPVS